MASPTVHKLIVDCPGNYIPGASEPRLSYLFMNCSPAIFLRIAPYPQRASVIRNDGLFSGSYREVGWNRMIYILNCSFCPVNHCNTVACGYFGVGCGLICIPQSACGHNCDFCQKGVYFLLIEVGNISAKTLYVRKTPFYLYPQMVLGKIASSQNDARKFQCWDHFSPC